MKSLFKPMYFILAAGLALPACASTGTVDGNAGAAQYVTPLVTGKTCGGSGFYQMIKNSHGSRTVIATVETDISHDPNGWYPTQRKIHLKPGQSRNLGCTLVPAAQDAPEHFVSYSVKGARFD